MLNIINNKLYTRHTKFNYIPLVELSILIKIIINIPSSNLFLMIQEFYAKQTVDKYAYQIKPYKVVTFQALLQKTACHTKGNFL